jgi:hypothetical protein
MDIKKTITSIFIVPTLGINKDKLKDNGYINGYIKDVRKQDGYEDCIYLLFKPTDLDKFGEFLNEEYERTQSIIDDYDYEDGYVVVVYIPSSRIGKDLELVKQGKYSKTSSQFQQLFPKVIKIKVNGLSRDQLSIQYRIFNKTNDLKEYWEEKLGVEFDEDQEVWYGFFEEEEVLDLDKIKNYV